MAFSSSSPENQTLFDKNFDSFHRQHPPTSDMWKFIRNENRKTRTSLDRELVLTFYSEMKEQVEYRVGSCATAVWEKGPAGTWMYYFDDGRYMRRKDNHHHPPQTVVAMEEQPAHQVLGMSLSPTEEFIAYMVQHDQTGSQHLIIKEILDDGLPQNETEIKLPSRGGRIAEIEIGAVQSDGSLPLYVVQMGDKGRPDTVLTCTISTTNGGAVPNEWHVLYHSIDPKEMVHVQRTKGCHYVALESRTKTSVEMYLSSGATHKQLVRKREANVPYYVDVGENDDVFLLIGHIKDHLQLIETTVDKLPLLTEMKPPASGMNDEYSITGLDIFHSHLVISEHSKNNGTQRFRVVNRKENETKDAVIDTSSFPDSSDCTQLSMTGNMDFRSPYVVFGTESPVQPRSSFTYDFNRDLVSQRKGGPNPLSGTVGSTIQYDRHLVTSRDNTKVPLSFIYQTEPTLSHRSVVIVGYGAYGESVSLGFDPLWYPLVKRGVVLAFAHTRGGGELGQPWYNNGRLFAKTNAIDDFEACSVYAKDLWRGLLTAKTTSAGGVVVGATMNRQPELFDKVVFRNAFTDLYSASMDTSLPLTEHEWEEYGNPTEDASFERLIRSYCPVRNINGSATTYPSAFITGTIDDNNVPYWNATTLAKAMSPASDRVLLNIEQSGGHDLIGTRGMQVAAMEAAFILD